MPKIFITGIAIFLLLGSGYGMVQAARSIPWDCSDWQALVHEDRTTAILETLAENRGKTLYCGIDQSDTFAKAETWAAGRDRNERDDTVYYGERGRFRGFTAAQEGWLTEGESGITGQSIASIFEFPKEEKKRRRKQYRRDVTDAKWYPEGSLLLHRVQLDYFGPEDSASDSTAADTAAREALEESLTTEERNQWARSNGEFYEWVQLRAEQDGRYNGGASGFCRSLGYDRALNVETSWDDRAGAEVNYMKRTVGGTYYSRAQMGLLYTNVDCVRRR